MARGNEGFVQNYYVYIVASWSRVLYIGMTNDLQRRVWQHRTKAFEGFSCKYNCRRLIYFEVFPDPTSAIACEKELKGWLRVKKIALIESKNPTWCDLWTEIQD